MKMKQEHSCGAVLFTEEDGIRQYVLVMEVTGSYGFPKGHQEGNETDLETAVREIKEETGITNLEFIPNLKRTIRYKVSENAIKEVVYFVAKYQGEDFDIQLKNEILSAKKYPIEAALSLLKYQEMKNILIEIDYMLEEMKKWK